MPFSAQVWVSVLFEVVPAQCQGAAGPPVGEVICVQWRDAGPGDVLVRRQSQVDVLVRRQSHARLSQGVETRSVSAVVLGGVETRSVSAVVLGGVFLVSVSAEWVETFCETRFLIIFFHQS